MKKVRVISVAVIAAMLIQMLGLISFAAELTGSGTAENPYKLATYAELAEFRSKVNSGEIAICAELTADIDVSAETSWTPISGFTGIFNGGGHKISGFGISSDLAGFFQNAGAATIKNLIIQGSVNGVNYSAGIVGGNKISGDISIENCLFIGNVQGKVGASGICYEGTVKNCGVVGNVTGTHEVGGIGLWTKATNCFVFGTVEATNGLAVGVANGDGTSNSYYRETNAATVIGYGTKKSAEAFSSGEVTYLLGDAFGQKIGTDPHPVFRTEDNRVYKSGVGYSNTEGGNAGTETDPYLINTYAGLCEFRNLVNSGEVSACAKLAADIIIPSGTEWEQIGTGAAYEGTFDGNGHKITGFSMTDGGYGNAGFFKNVGKATIKNLTICGNVIAGDMSAGFAGNSSSNTIIANCMFIGDVKSTWARVSGFSRAGTIVNCGFIGDVSGTSEVSAMGLETNAANCFIYGTIEAINGNTFGISNTAAANSYLLNAKATGGSYGHGTKKSAEAFECGEVAYLLGSAFGQKTGTDLYPVFRTKDNQVYKLEVGYSNTEDNGTAEKPYKIATYNDLVEFRTAVNNGKTSICVELVRDIDLSAETNWTPIGFGDPEGSHFAGTFNGNGHKLTNLNSSGGWYKGLFAWTNGATVKNLGIESGMVSGGQCVAAFIGRADNTTVDKCWSKAAIFSDTDGGGNIAAIAGYSDNSVFSNCYNQGSVGDDNDENVFGIAGGDSEIINSYNSGNMQSKSGSEINYIGASADKIKNCWYKAGSNQECGGNFATANDFECGKVAYYLRNAFGQKLEGDDFEEYPVIKDNDKVWFADGEYFNYDSSKGFLAVCDGEYLYTASPAEMNGLIVIPVYDENGVLKSVAQKEAVFGGENKISVSGEIGKNENYKVLILEDLINIKPLGVVIKLY